MTVRTEVREIATCALAAASTLAGANVRPVSVMPTVAANATAMPVLFVQCPLERKTSLGRGGAPKFFTTVSLVVVARVANADERRAEVAIDTLVDQVHAAILSCQQLLRLAQQIAEVETTVMMDGAGKVPIGEATIHFAVELYQTYQPPIGEPLIEIDLTVQAPDGRPLAQAAIDPPQT